MPTDTTAANTPGSSVRWAERGTVHTLLPDPVPEPLVMPVVSVDDHLVEPPDLFVGRLPQRFVEPGPRIVVDDAGVEYWSLGAELVANRTLATSVVGRPPEEWRNEPVLFSEMRAGSYVPGQRLYDMDLAGVWASLAFPSSIFGFVGQVFHRMADRELGLVCLRAYNDWMVEEWAGADQARLIAQQLPWLPDPEIAADEIRRNAARGVQAVTFSENPEALGYPSIYQRVWDPFWAACDETETVVNLHIGSSSRTFSPSSETPIDGVFTLFPVNAILSTVDWIFSQVPTVFPGLKIAMSEGGLSWVPMVMERLRRAGRAPSTGHRVEQREDPIEVLQRNFHFASIEDPSGIEHRHEIGIDRIMLEVDYPHPDTSWPLTQSVLAGELGHLPEAEQRQLAYVNACRLYRIPEPPAAWVAEREASAARVGSG